MIKRPSPLEPTHNKMLESNFRRQGYEASNKINQARKMTHDKMTVDVKTVPKIGAKRVSPVELSSQTRRQAVLMRLWHEGHAAKQGRTL